MTELFGVGPDSRWSDVAILGYMEDDSTLADGMGGNAALEAPWASDWVINVVPVNQRLEDWEWDR